MSSLHSRRRVAAFLCTVLLSGAASIGAMAQSKAPDPALGAVDDKRLLAAGKESGDWITFGRDYTNQRFAPFAQIDRANVAKLSPVWIYQMGTVGSTQTHPLVVGGVMYVTMPGNDVAAIDAATGDQIWRYRHKMRSPLAAPPSNRGVAVAYGRVYEETDDARAIALDQATGKVVWDEVIQPYDASALVPKGQKKPEPVFRMRMPPLAYDGKVIVESVGFEGDVSDASIKASLAAGTDVGMDWINSHLGNRAFYSALDAGTGAEAWRWYTTKEKGWEGAYVATTPDGMPLNRDLKAEKEAAKLYKNAWAAGANAAYWTPAFDPKMGLLFVSTGNPAPGNIDLIRPGDNLYANSVVALDAKTGRVRWFFQEAPHGQYDATGQVVLLDATVGGRTVPAVLNCGKSGWCFVMDRATGKLLFRSDEVVPHQNTYNAWNSAMSQAPEGVMVAPGDAGGVGISPVSYDAGSGVVYVGGIHRPVVMTLEKTPNAPGGPALFKNESKTVPLSQGWGTLTALDLKNGGHTLWQVKTPQPLIGGTLATSGGLVFSGEANGHFDAYDATTGKTLWSYQTGANVGAAPMSYMVGGRQYIAVATGAAAGNSGARAGGAVMVFALPSP